MACICICLYEYLRITVLNHMHYVTEPISNDGLDVVILHITLNQGKGVCTFQLLATLSTTFFTTRQRKIY